MTDAERKLWFHLRSGRLGGFKFRRQHPVPPYIVDFYCHDALLAVELDGSQHGPETDAVRTTALERHDIHVLRFWDDQVFTETEAVLEQILRSARTRTLTRPTTCISEIRVGERNAFADASGGAPSPDGRGEKQHGIKQ